MIEASEKYARKLFKKKSKQKTPYPNSRKQQDNIIFQIIIVNSLKLKTIVVGWGGWPVGTRLWTEADMPEIWILASLPAEVANKLKFSLHMDYLVLF